MGLFSKKRSIAINTLVFSRSRRVLLEFLHSARAMTVAIRCRDVSSG